MSIWKIGTKSAPTNAEKIERTRRAKEASREREAERIEAYWLQQERESERENLVRAVNASTLIHVRQTSPYSPLEDNADAKTLVISREAIDREPHLVALDEHVCKVLGARVFSGSPLGLIVLPLEEDASI